MIETLLVCSVLVNIGFLFYARWLIKVLQVKEEETSKISRLIAQYVLHVKGIHEMEMFYGDQTLQSLITHGVELIENLENSDYIIYEIEETEEEEVND